MYSQDKSRETLGEMDCYKSQNVMVDVLLLTTITYKTVHWRPRSEEGILEIWQPTCRTWITPSSTRHREPRIHAVVSA